jgi:hypothetical protein
MKASPGSRSLLIRPTASPSRHEQTLAVTAYENQAVVAAATDGKASVEYWVRCLPHDFPQITWTPHAEAGAPTAGYYLLGTALPPFGASTYAFMLDRHGVPVWYTQQGGPYGSNAMFDVDNVIAGAISYFPLPGATFEVLALAPATTSYVGTGEPVDEHELRYLSNGDAVFISSPVQAGVDLTGLQVLLPDGGSETVNGPQDIIACNLVEVAPDGGLVWSWTGTAHFDPVLDTTWAQQSGAEYSVFHCNSIDVDPANDNLLVSARQMNSVFYIERATGKVLWKMGGAAASLDDAAYIGVADPFVCQHDARLISGWSETKKRGTGQVSVFDDQTGGAGPARAVIYDVSVALGDGGSPDAGVASVAWQYPGSAVVPEMGSFRISTDGSRVIGWGDDPNHGFTEVDALGHDVLDMAFTDGDVSYRAIKIPLSAFDLEVLRNSAGLP